MTKKYSMTVDEAVKYIVDTIDNANFEGWAEKDYRGKGYDGDIRPLIESLCAQAVEEYKAQNPPAKWLPITDKQKDGEYYLVTEFRKGDWVKDYLRYSVTYSGWFSARFDIEIEPTHYLPIDQIPLPEKEQKQ